MDNKLRNKKGQTEEEFLAAYNPGKYERPSVTVDMLIFTDTGEASQSLEKVYQLLMIRRGDHPYIGWWALPGGFVNMDENLDEAAYRELKEETGVENISLEQLYTWGDVGRDPRTRTISTSYLALVDSRALPVQAGDDADDAKWFTVSLRIASNEVTDTEKGYVQHSLYTLKLTNEKEELSAEVKTVKTVEDKITRTESSIISSEGIAFDHAKIIVFAMDKLQSK